MAFGKKYYSSYKSNNDIDYYLEIWLKDYDSTASEITLGAGGPVITYETEEDDRFSPILSSNCRLPLMVTNTLLQTFVSQLRTTYQEKQVYLHLYKATSSTYTTTKPIWSGFLTMDLGSGEDVSFPYEQELIFVDGLSLLKEIDFVDFSDPDYETRIAGNYAPENMYWGPARYTFWIKEILLKSGAAISGVNGQGVTQDYGFTTAVNWYNGTMTSTSQSSDPLFLTQCKASMFHTKDENETFLPDNCYDVLKELLRHWGARITYWKHEFWIVQIPEYIVDESGFIDNPDNINSRQYNKSGTYLGSQDHLGDTYSSRYEQTIQSDQISKLVGTKYNYLPAIHRVNAKFLSLNGENHFGGFPFGANPYGIDFFQSRIANPSSADFLWVSIPLNWKWDMSGTALLNGHTNGWWARIRFNLYCTQNNGGTITTYYLQYKSSDDSYYWVDSSNWTPLGNESPAYIISSRNLVETDYIGFQEQIEFVDSSGSSIALTGDWDFYMSIENYGTSANNPGSFYCRFSPGGQIKRNPTGTAPSLPAPGGGGASTGSGTVSWSNSLQDNSISFNSPTASATNFPSGYNTGASQVDKGYTWKSPLKGFLQVLSNTVNTAYGLTNDTIVSNSSNTEVYGFGDLLFGDCILETARGNLNVWNGSAFTKTNVNGKWGRGILTGEKTFTQMLIDEFLTGQIKVIISPSMRLVVGEQNKNQTSTASGGGTATRPRYVNPIGRLRETRSNETDPEYFFRRGSFHTLYDEWDYEGYQILRDTITVTTNTNDIGGLGGSQTDNPIDAAKVKSNVETALMMNSPVAYVRTTVPATGSNVIVNGNFNVATGWTLGTGWTIDTTTKKAKFAATGSTSDLVQSVLTAELTYQINFTVEVTAGSLIVKAGSTGTSQTITTSGDYSIYLDCEGSTDIKFTAGTTFTGTITYITAKDQKSISSIPINVIGSTVFKTNDTLDLINSRDGEIMTLNVSSNQGASDDTISVTSTPLFEDVAANSVLLINQDDLSAQYQNKTKGTVGGFDITATSIDSGSVAISSYIDDDSFGTASATSLATSESIKAYVDGQAGLSENLQQVTDNGATTTNNITIGSTYNTLYKNDGFIFTDNQDYNIKSGNEKILDLHFNEIKFYSGNTERMRLNSTGLGIGTTSPATKLHINRSDNGELLRLQDTSNANQNYVFETESVGTFYGLNIKNNSTGLSLLNIGADQKIGIATNNPLSSLHVNKQAANTHQILIGNSSGLGIGHDSSGQQRSIIGSAYGNAASMISFTLGGYTTSSDKMTILGSGNVGINQVNPTEKLHVVGDALITGDSHADAFKPAVSGNPIKFKNFDSTTEFARITDGGNVLISTTSDDGSSKLQVDGVTSSNGFRTKPGNTDYNLIARNSSNTALYVQQAGSGAVLDVRYGSDLASGGTSALSITSAGTATFSGQVTIPATPVASTDAASKGYVDAQVSATDSLQEVTTVGNTTNNSIMIGSTYSPTSVLDIRKDDAVLTISDSSSSNVNTGDTQSSLLFKGQYYSTANDLSYSQARIRLLKGNTDGNAGSMMAFDVMNLAGGSSVLTERMRLTGGGNVLIGGTTDLNSAIKLQLTNSADNRIQITTSNGFSDASLDLCNTSDNKGWRVIHRNNTNFEIQYASSLSSGIIGGVSTALAIDSSLNTTLSGSLTGTTATFSGQVSAGTHFKLQSGGKLYSNASNVTLQSASGSYLGFNISTSEKMRLNSTGLGIGTSSPSTDLHIKSTSAGSGYATIENTVHFSKLDLKSSTHTGSIIMDGTGGFISGGGLLLNTTNNRIKFLEGGSASMILQSGNLAIGGTPGAVYKFDVVGKARVQSVLELDDVLTLNQISTPADPASGQSSIYMDSADGAIKCKINVGGTVVTRTIASFE